MNRTVLTPLIALAWLGSLLPAQAASTTDLSVYGLITPSACEPSLSNGGMHDLGKIAARDLNADQTTPLPTYSLQMAITCEALTLLALEPRDNRLGSNYDSDKPFKFGLGLVNDQQKLGYMVLRLQALVADGIALRPIGQTDPVTWAPSALLSPDFLTSFAAIGTLVPTPVQVLNAELNIAPTIAPTNTLSLENEVPIDGSVTLSMKYL